MNDIEELERLLARCTAEQRREIFDLLRLEFPIHPIETKLNAQAEVILEAIDRASDLTLRGIRGVIADAAFEVHVVKHLSNWTDKTPRGDYPFDFLLQDAIGFVKVQVKMQRSKEQRPMMANEARRHLPSNMYVVETQRTRGGTDPATGENSRPYRFNEFDILAVSMHPSCNDWSQFFYTVTRWLLPDPSNENYLLKFQPVSKSPNDMWTNDFDTCVSWFRSGENKKIWQPTV